MTRPDRGQATVELALSLPLLLLVVLGMAQVAVIVVDQLAVLHAAREGARAASVSSDPATAARQAAESATDVGHLVVDTTASGGTVTVRVVHDAPTGVVLVGALLPDVRLTGTVTMALEPP